PAVDAEWALVEQLAGPDWRLIVTGEKDGKATAEGAHEILFKTWPTLKRWLEDERDFLVWRRELGGRGGEDHKGGRGGGPPRGRGACGGGRGSTPQRGGGRRAGATSNPPIRRSSRPVYKRSALSRATGSGCRRRSAC